MDALTITTMVTLLANTIAAPLSDDELVLFAAIFTQIGDTLVTISTIRESIEAKNPPSQESPESSTSNDVKEENNETPTDTL